MLLTSSDMGHLTKHFSDVSRLCFRVRLINQCRRRVRKKRRAPLSHPSRLSGLFCSSIENINHWFPEFEHSSTASAVPPWSIQAHYPIRAFEIFTSSFDPLAIHHINQLFPLMRSSLSARSLDEVRTLSTAISSCVPSCLSSMKRCHYESVVGSSYPGAHLAPLGGDDLPIVVDTGASRSLSPIQSDVVSFKPLHCCLHIISAETNIEGEGLLQWDIIGQNGIKSTIKPWHSTSLKQPYNCIPLNTTSKNMLMVAWSWTIQI